jgi:hypothetical protein
MHSISFSFAAWVIPTVLTVLSLLAAWAFTRKNDVLFAGMGFWLGPALFVSLCAWVLMLSLPLWLIPTAFTLLMIFAAWFLSRGDTRLNQGLGFLLWMIPGAILSLIAWFFYGIYLYFL